MAVRSVAKENPARERPSISPYADDPADAAGATAAKADALLRQALAGAGVTVPARVDLEIGKYVNNRGTKKLMFKPQHEIKDPFAGK